MSTDSDIIARSREDPAAFGILFDRHSASIHRYVARRTNTTVADDVMAETFLVAFERRGSFNSEYTNAAPWLFGIATNRLRHHHRQEIRALRAMARADQQAAGRSSYVEDSAVNARLDAMTALRDVGRRCAECLRSNATPSLSMIGPSSAMPRSPAPWTCRSAPSGRG